ncbi:MAG: DUF4157 domain-containing protein [Vicinamibacterales bacterium]
MSAVLQPVAKAVQPAAPAAAPGRPVLQRKCACGGSTAAEGECADCANERLRLQRRPDSLAAPRTIPGIVTEVLGSTGHPLDAQTRAFMEPRFGHDLSRVRIHWDQKAIESARAVNALAYTVGRDIVFGPGQYAPGTRAGRRVIAHELTHVVQQAQASGDVHGIETNATLETEAERTAQRIESGENRIGLPSVATSPGLQRLAGPEIPVTPAQIEEMRVLFQQVNALMRTSALTAEESAAISTAVAEAEAAIVTAGEVAAAGATATAVGEGAVGASAALAADDVTGIGVADDVAIPFTLLAAAVGFGVGYLLASSAEEIDAAWRTAAEAVKRAVDIMRRTTRRTRTQPQPEPQRPLPRPDIDVDEDTGRRCRSMAVAQRGANNCHDQFATSVSGVSREWGVETPEGLYADFDALGQDRVLYEIKTGYRFLLNTSPATYQLRERTIHNFINQSANQLAVATRCGYPLVWVFNDRTVADFVDGFIEPPVTSRPFDCDLDQ